MNKTININLGGIFFHIDELAYQKLNRYLDAIRRSLSDDPQGKDEILNDIELRIGELLSERIKDARQVVNQNDIDEITKIMGKPEDYLVDEDVFEDEPRRARSASKKLFRDVDDKFLGGVCSGLAHYFGIDVIWMRIIWLILLFGFGIGFLLYPLLWILVPQANTTTEKLQMKGEPVNISNIERKIREEFHEVTSRVKDGVNDVTEKVKNSDFKKRVQNRTKSGIQEIVETIGNICLTILKIFGKFIGGLIIFISTITLIALIIGAFSWGSFEILGVSDGFINYPHFFIDSIIPTWLLIVFAFLAIGIPFVVLFMLGLRIISSNIKSFNTTTKLSLLGIWIVAVLGLGFGAINFATRTAIDGSHSHTEDIQIVANDTLKIQMIGNDELSNRGELRRQYNYEKIYDGDEQKLFSTRLNVFVKATDNSNASIKIRKESEGKNRANANSYAEALEYQYNLNDKNLLLNGYFLSDSKNIFKDQTVEITLYLPINSVVYLDNSTQTFLKGIKNVQNIKNRNIPEHYFKMTDKGLECLDCDPSIFSQSYQKENGFIKVDIDAEGAKINLKDGENDAEIKLDKNGITIQ
jgi:phage shock protein PspC (stress-responsive transcriptional regulator)